MDALPAAGERGRDVGRGGALEQLAEEGPTAFQLGGVGAPSERLSECDAHPVGRVVVGLATRLERFEQLDGDRPLPQVDRQPAGDRPGDDQRLRPFLALCRIVDQRGRPAQGRYRRRPRRTDRCLLTAGREGGGGLRREPPLLGAGHAQAASQHVRLFQVMPHHHGQGAPPGLEPVGVSVVEIGAALLVMLS